MELEQLDALYGTPKPQDPLEAEPFEQDEQALADIQEAMGILCTVKTMLDYVANPDLVKTITKRERDNLNKVSEKVRRFLATIEPTYD